jgi:hypothetical protein
MPGRQIATYRTPSSEVIDSRSTEVSNAVSATAAPS